MEFERIADQKRLNFIIDTLEKNLPENSVVLDVGCGNGVISRALGKKGYNVFGISKFCSEVIVIQSRIKFRLVYSVINHH